MSENIVIDCKSLVEWLESRRKLEKDWVNKLKGVQLKYKEIIEEVKQKPYEDVKSWLADKEKEFNYLDLVELFEKLKGTPEASAKTLFGNYSSKLMKEISSLLKVVEKSNLHLAEIAKELSQLSNFEGPSLLKSKQSNEADIKQFETKKTLLANSISRLKAEETEFLTKNDLQKDAIDQSISNRVHTVPEKIDQFLKKLRADDVKKYLNHYYKLTEFLSAPSKQDCKLNHIEFLIKYGDLPVNNFVSFVDGKAGDINQSPFDYTRYFNRQGYYTHQPSSIDDGRWSIEEVVDITASIDQWQIVDEDHDGKDGAKKDAPVQADRSAMLSQNFRDGLSAEIEEVRSGLER